MTPRLKFLSVGLAISLAYSIYDYIDRNKKEETVVASKKSTSRPRTAGASKQRAIDLKKRIEERKANSSSEKSQVNSVIAKEGFSEIAEELLSLEGWDRNPFVDVYEAPPVNNLITTNQPTPQLTEEAGIATLDGLIIKTAVVMGEKAFVTINGQIFREGDLINDALIEKIENEQITFKVGKTRIIKDVGT